MAATTNTWIATATSTGDWNTAANWEEDAVPTSGATVVFNPESGSTVTVTLSDYIYAGSITVNGGGEVVLTQVASLGSNPVLTFPSSGTISLASGSTLDVEISSFGYSSFGGAIVFSGDGTVVNDAVLWNSTSTTIDTGVTVEIGQFGMLNAVTVEGGASLETTYTGTENQNTAIGTLSGTGTVVLPTNTHLNIYPMESSTFSGLFSGGGDFLLEAGSSSDVMTLTGNSASYTGGVTLSTGTLAFSGPGAFSSNVSINFTGAATLDITAANSDVTIQNLSSTAVDGSQATGSTITLGVRNFTVVQSSSAQDQAYYETYSGSITSTGGGFTKAGPGTLILGATNSYTGGTAVTEGTLQILSTGTLYSGGALSLSSGTTFSTASAGLTLGAISGSGALKVTAGTLTLTNANSSYTGAITISGGTVVLSGAGSIATAALSELSGTLDISETVTGSTISTLSGSGAIDLGGKILTITQGSAGGTFSGVLSDGGVGGGVGGSLVKSGSGLLTLSGSSSYTGPTIVADGILGLYGSITSNATVEDAATFLGTGTVSGNANILSGGTISPGVYYLDTTTGDSVLEYGILTIDGAVIAEEGSTIYLVVDSAANGLRGLTEPSLLAISGTATVDGSIDIVLSPGTEYSVGTFTVLSSTGLTNAGSTTLDSSSTYNLAVTQTVTSDDVQITIRTIVIEPSASLSKNGRHFVEYLNALVDNPEYAVLFQKLGYLQTLFGGERLENALNMVHPASRAISTFVSSNTQFEVAAALASRSATWRFWHAMGEKSHPESVAALMVSNQMIQGQPQLNSCILNMGRAGDRYAVWFNPFGDITHATSSIGAVAPFHVYTGGGLLGLDCCLSDCGLVEGAIGIARSNAILGDNLGHQSANYYIAALNGVYSIDNFYVEAGLLASYDQLQSARNISFVRLQEQATSSHNMWQLMPQLNFSYLFWAKVWGVEPFIAESWVFNFEQQVVEHGAGGLDTSTKARTSSLLRSEYGLHFYRDWQLSNSSSLLFRITAGYVNQQPFHLGAMTISFVEVGGGFQVDSFTNTENLGTVGAELVYSAPNGIFASVQYDGEFGSGYGSNELQLQIGYSF